MTQESSNIKLQPVDAGDVPFLLELFASTRETELAALAPELRSEFVRMQFSIRDRQYRDSYPGASDDLILVGDTPIGRLVVDRSPEVITLVDISFLCEFRGRGIGTQLIRKLIGEATSGRLWLQLHVYKFNPAVRLYQRLGFSLVGEESMYLNMYYRTQDGR